ncbi:MAG: FecR domain-containing protein [Bacteroidota bacterium]
MNQNDLINKWLLNDLSETERLAFNGLEEASFYKTIIEDAVHFKAAQFTTAPDFEVFKERITSNDNKVRTLSWVKPFTRIAASVAIAAFGLLYYLNLGTTTEVETLVAQKTIVSLPDDSQVTLNALTELSFDEDDWKTNRAVKLEGEAFFDVAKGSKFDVVTSEGTVTVVGTEFNVKQRGDFFEVACFEGVVRVESNGQTEILRAGDNLKQFEGAFYKGKNNYQEPQWTNNTSYFQRVPLIEVFEELERQYALTVIFDDINTDQLFTGGFAHQNLDSALIALSEPLGLDYEILKENTVRFTIRE